MKAFVVRAEGAPDVPAELPGSHPRGTTTIIKEGTEMPGYLQRAVIFHPHRDEAGFESAHNFPISPSWSLFSMLPEQR